MLVSIVRLTAKRLSDRLDAVYYHPSFLKNEDKLRNSSIKILKLKNLVKEGRRSIYFSTETLEISEAPNNWVPFLTADDFGEDGFFINLNSRRRVSPKFADKYPKGNLRGNELLVKVKGPNQITAYNSMPPENRVLVSGKIWGALVKKEQVDPHYLVSILSCPYAVIARSRLRTNLNVEFLGSDDLLNLELPVLVVREAQTYIGDKVRMAERLRERSRELELEAKELFEDTLSWEKQLESKKLHGRVTCEQLEHRLDINFNSPNRLSLLKHLTFCTITVELLANLVEISAMIGWKGLTTEYYTDKGLWLLRGVEFSKGVIDFDSLVSVQQYKYDEQPQIHLKEGDIAFTKDETIGKAIVIPHLSNPLAAGSTVARLRLQSDYKINRYYLEYALNHPVVQIQVMSFATGMAQPHITQEWIARLLIPRCDIEEKIGRNIQFHHEALVQSQSLTTAAKLLVEALIEGKLTEDELKTAQISLQKGDREPDKAILSRLTRKGIDIKDEPPLFPDINALYEIIDQINKEGEEET